MGKAKKTSAKKTSKKLTKFATRAVTVVTALEAACGLAFCYSTFNVAGSAAAAQR